MEASGEEGVTTGEEMSESRSSDDAGRSEASNCKRIIGQSATAEGGGKENSDCIHGNGNYAWYVETSGRLYYNNNKTNSYYVRAVSEAPATANAVYNIPFSTIVEAWLDCERNKRTAPSAIRFRWHAQRELYNLWRQMRSGQYKQGMSVTFMVHYPVLREVWAASFRDRVVHHWEALRFDPVIQNFITEAGNRSYNCRKGFSNLQAIAQLVQDIKDFTKDGTRDDCYIVGGDFANFFMSVDKKVLWKTFERLIVENYKGDDIDALLYMTHTTMMGRCTDYYTRRGDESEWDNLPKRKSLFYMDGLPIGNLPSQLWANMLGAVFMDWMVNVKGLPLVLFVDDWRTLVRTRQEGRELLREVEVWLRDNLHIQLHPNKKYLQHWKKGTKLTGAIIKPGRTYISNRTRGSMISKIMWFNNVYGERMRSGEIKEETLQHWHVLSRIRASMNSYLGLMVKHSSYKIRRRIILKYFLPVWGRWFYVLDDIRCVKIKNHYNLPRQLHHRLKNHAFAAKFLRPQYIDDQRPLLPEDKMVILLKI